MAETVYQCPDCSNILKLRNGWYGKFYGCSSYPKCRKTVPVVMIESYAISSVGEVKQQSILEYNQYQSDFFAAIKSGSENIIMKACAGSGKTTTLEHSIHHIPKKKSIIYLVFNTKNEVEAKVRMPPRCTVKTTHSLGYWVIRQALGNVKVNPNKLKNAVFTHMKKVMRRYSSLTASESWKMVSQLAYASTRTISLLKNRLEEPTETNILKLLGTYDINILPTNSYYSEYLKAVKLVYTQTSEDTDSVDFDDMLFFPYYHYLDIPKFDFVLSDEIQDFNAAQINLVLNSIGERGVGVGDENQSIYGFRGAMLTSMQEFSDQLNCVPYPLSMTFRVPRVGVQRINQNYPDIDFIGWDGAIEGVIEDVELPEFLGSAQDGDLVICRNNAPLIGPVYRLLRDGKKAVIVGKDIGVGIKRLFQKENVTEQSTMVSSLTLVVKSLSEQQTYWLGKGMKWKAHGIADQIATIEGLSMGCKTLGDLYHRLGLIFTNELEGILFSTIHRAKGLEANNVGILYPNLIPSVYATQAWELAQERNIRYVAETRFKNRMSLIKE